MSFTKVTSAGIGSTELVTLDSLEVINNASIGGVLTYEDVTNVDSIGIITARAGVLVGSGITLSKDGDIFATGVTTATTFSGSGASLTNLPAANLTGTLPAISGANLTNLDASDLASGTVPTARLGSGTASSSTFLRGDSTFATVTTTTINSNTNNYLITGTGTADTLQGEANLTFNGTNFTTKASDSTTSANAGGSGILIQNTNNTNNNQNFLGFYDSTGTSSAAIIAQHENHSSTTGNLQFGTRNAGTYAERLRITSGGNVLIDTTVTTEATADASDIIIGTTSDTQKGISIVGSTSGGIGNLYFTDGAGYKNQGRIAYYHADDSMRFTTNVAERFRINSSGNVGVNTDFTGSQTWRSGNKLEIFGGGGNVTGELHIGANRGDGAQSVGSINFFDNTQDSTHRHIALIEADKVGSTSNKRGGDLLFYTKGDNVAAPTARMRIDNKGYITTPTQCSVAVRMSANHAWPGNHAFTTDTGRLEFDTEVWDIGGNFNTSQYTFTAPVTGRYLMNYLIQFENFTGFDWIYMYPVVNDSISDTNSRGIVFSDFGSGSSNSASATYWTFNHSLVAKLQANDVVKFKVRGGVTSGTIKGTTESQWNIDLLG